MIRKTPYIKLEETEIKEDMDNPSSPLSRKQTIFKESAYHSSFFYHPGTVIVGSMAISVIANSLAYIIACQYIPAEVIQAFMLATFHLTIPQCIIILMFATALIATLDVIFEFNNGDFPIRPKIDNF